MANQTSILPDLRFQFTNVVDLLSYRAIHQPHQNAYTFLDNRETERGSITYQQLELQAQSIAAYLQLLGVSGERILLLYQPSLEFITAFLGCLYAKVLPIPVDLPRRNQKMNRLKAITRDAQATAVLTTADTFDLIKQRSSEEEELAFLQCIATDNLSSTLAQSWQPPKITNDTTAFLQYTSGSTGVPKGVMVSHGNLLHNEYIIQNAFGHTEETIILGWLPFYHDMGLIGNVLQPLYIGRPCILIAPMAFMQQPIRWLQAISDYQVTTSGGPNFAYDLCVRKITSQQLESLDLSSWEVAFNGAEPIRADTLQRFTEKFAPCGFRKEAFYPCYGMAETTLMVSGGTKTSLPVFETVEEEALEKNLVVSSVEKGKRTRTLVSCGKALEDNKIVIVNPNTLESCPEGQVGEIWIFGKSVAQGYWNKPTQTQETFHAYLKDTKEGPFLRTGDLGFLKNKELFITGRLKNLIIIRGRNYYPNEIELTVENSHSAFKSSSGAVFVIEDGEQQKVIAVQEVQRQFIRKLNINEVVAQARKAVLLHHQLQLHKIVLVKPHSLPKTTSGKIQRHLCRDSFMKGELFLI